MKQIAVSRGGDCLSTIYGNNKTKLKWRCAAGHEWETAAMNVRAGKWCGICAGELATEHLKLGIEEMQILAKKRDGFCISKTYKNSKTKLKWKCSKGHVWEAIPESIKKGSWCKLCSYEKGWSKRKRK